MKTIICAKNGLDCGSCEYLVIDNSYSSIRTCQLFRESIYSKSRLIICLKECFSDDMKFTEKQSYMLLEALKKGRACLQNYHYQTFYSLVEREILDWDYHNSIHYAKLTPIGQMYARKLYSINTRGRRLVYDDKEKTSCSDTEYPFAGCSYKRHSTRKCCEENCPIKVEE